MAVFSLSPHQEGVRELSGFPLIRVLTLYMRALFSSANTITLWIKFHHIYVRGTQTHNLQAESPYISPPALFVAESSFPIFSTQFSPRHLSFQNKFPLPSPAIPLWAEISCPPVYFSPEGCAPPIYWPQSAHLSDYESVPLWSLRSWQAEHRSLEPLYP